MRALRPGSEVRVMDSNGRLRHGIVVTVTTQDSITVRIGHNGVPFAVTRVASNAHRAEHFE